MYLDVFTVSALVDEFMDTLVGGRIQDSVDVNETGIGLEIYANHRRQYLYLSADQSIPRIHLVAAKFRRGVPRPTQLGLLFRRFVEGGVINHVSQPPWERVIHFDIDGPEGEIQLIIEPMERRSNILLVQGGIILDCMRRVGPSENRYRLSLPSHEYVAPPPQVGKSVPFDITADAMHTFFDQAKDPKTKSFQVLTSHLLGMSPLLAREIVFRASSNTQEKATQANPDALLMILNQMMEPLQRREWQPGIVDNEGVIEAFSVYPIEHLSNWHPVEKISEALAAFYGAPVGEDAYNAAKKPVRSVIQEARAKMNAKLASLERGVTDDSEREILKQSGELILAYQYTIQKGETELRAFYDMDKPELVVKLDPQLSPMDNAQHYFVRYNKAKRALDDVPRLIQETKTELAYLAQLDTDLDLASNWPEIDDVQQALQASGFWQGKKVKRIGGGGQSVPIRVVTRDGYIIWVGRNSRQNEMVTFKKATADDLWLHAHDIPGAHVIIKFDGRNIPEHIIDQAASIAAYYSAKRADGKVQVDVTRCKYVKKIKGAGQGMVTYRNEKSYTVVPHSEKYFEENLENS